MSNTPGEKDPTHAADIMTYEFVMYFSAGLGGNQAALVAAVEEVVNPELVIIEQKPEGEVKP